MPTSCDLDRLSKALEQLNRIGRSRKAHAIRELRSGIRLPHGAQDVLRQLVLGGPQRISDAARAIRSSEPQVSRHVALLESEGLVARESSPHDGRVAIACVTSAGRRAHRKLQRAHDQMMGEQLKGWSARDLALATSLIERLVADLRVPVSATAAQDPSHGRAPVRAAR